MEHGPPDLTVWGAVIGNASDLPVYGVRYSFCVAVDRASGLDWRAGERIAVVSPIVLVPRRGSAQEKIPDHIREQEEAGGNKPRWLIAIEFTDADGRRWLRDPRGRLNPADALAEDC